MASCITSKFGNSYCPQVQLSASVTSETNTTATISWTLKWVTHGYTISSSSTKSYSVKIAGTVVKSGSFAYGGKTTTTIASGTKTINKTTSSQSISCSFTFAMTFTWAGSTGSSQTKSCKVTVSAKPKYTISYNANGGSGTPSSQTKWYGTSIKLSTTKPTRTGYIFQGWGTSASGSVVYAPGATYSTNASDTLYAIWKIITYTVSYNANGGSGAPSSQTKNYGSSIKLSTTKPTRTNYNFKGWATSASGSVVYASGATYSNNANVTLYAVWELAYTVPTISNLKVSRCGSDGTADETGTYAKVTFSWSCSQLIGSNPVTSIVIKWGSSQSTVSASGNSGSVSHIIGTIDADTSVTISVVVTDSKNGSHTSSVVLPTAAFYLDFKAGGSGVAIGKVAETADLLDVGYKSRFRKNMVLESGTGANGSGGLYGKDPSTGAEVLILQPQNENGNTTIGYGNYERSKGAVNIYGNDITLYARNGIGIFAPAHGIDNRRLIGNNLVLWSGGMYMTEDHTATLSTAISNMLFGAIFVWSKYEDGASKNFNWHHFFVPKHHVLQHSGTGILMCDPYYAMRKYLYVSDVKVTGHAGNNDSGTTNGIAYANNTYVLRYILGI